MKKIIITIFIIFGLSIGLQAQKSEINKNFGVGFQLGQFQNDFGLGLNITSPYYINDKFAIRVRVNNLWYEHPDTKNKMTWTAYTNITAGLVSVAGNIGDFIRLYGEGGLVFILPSDKFSSNDSEFGGYGLFGFEFFFSPHTNYFIEIGGVGTGARANKFASEPIYSNGLIIGTGFRFQF